MMRQSNVTKAFIVNSLEYLTVILLEYDLFKHQYCCIGVNNTLMHRLI